MQAGLRWAIVATLISPNFLYRSELGIPVAEALANGWGNTGGSTGGTADDYVAGSGGVTVNGASFTNRSAGEAREGYWNLYTNGNISHSFTFTNPALIVLSLKGNDYLENNVKQWPQMTLTVGGRMIAMTLVDHYEFKEYRYLVTGVTGNQQVVISFNGDQGRQPYGTAGNDKDLHIGNVTVAPAVPKTVEPDPQSSLELADPAAFVLDPYEFAAALSYTYTGSLPDDTLLAAAKSGALNTEAGVAAQVDRLIASPKGERHVKHFVTVWMRTDKLYDQNFRRNDTKFTPAVRDSMVKELQEFFWYVFNTEGVPFADFYKADYTFLDQTLATFYGITRNANGASAATFVKTPTTVRGGVATTGAFLTTWAHPDQSSPILRAVNVRENMLCHHIDPPPETLVEERDQLAKEVEALKANGEMSTRLYYGKITTHPKCDGCHKTMINPLGFGMEDFSEIGLPRTFQLDLGLYRNQLTVDPSGELIGIEHLTDVSTALPFSGAKQLSKMLGDVQATQACLVEKTFRMATGRPISNGAIDVSKSERLLDAEEADDFNCAAEILNGALSENNQSPKAMFKALGKLDLIRFRR